MVYPEMIVGGAQTYLIKKAAWLREKGISVYLMTTRGDYYEAVSRAFTKTIVIDWVNDIKKYKKYINHADKVREVLHSVESLNIAVIECYHVDLAIFFEQVAQRLGIKNIFHPPIDLIYRKEFKSYIMFKMSRQELLGLSSKSLSLIKYGYRIKNDYDRYINVPVNKLEAVPDNHFTVPGWDSGCFKVLTVARLDKMKAYIGFLIKDLSRLSKERQVRISLAIVGYGVLEKKFKRIARECEYEYFTVAFLGKTYSPPVELYNLCDLYVGMGTTSIEAASLRKPVILADPGSKKCSGVFGVTNNNSSVLLPYEKTASFYYEIGKALSDRKLLSHYAEKVYELYKNEFSIDVVMYKYLKYLDVVLRNKINAYHCKFDFDLYSIVYRFARDIRDLLVQYRNNTIKAIEEFI